MNLLFLLHPLNLYLAKLLRLLIALFVLWHAFAVAIYSIPRDARDPFATLGMRTLLPIVTPYMLVTSQWQLWNVFAPDPQRRVTFYHIQVQREGRWERLLTLNDDTYSLWRHATQFKMLGNVLVEHNKSKEPLTQSYLQYICRQHGIPTGTPILLAYEYYLLPYHQKPRGATWWKQWEPQRETYAGLTTTCQP